MTDLAGRAELRAAAERAVFDAWAVRNGRQPTADESWWHIHRSGPTHTKWAADAAFDAIEPTLAAVEADRNRLQGERDEARAQLAEVEHTLDGIEAAARDLDDGLADALALKIVADVRAALAASRPSPDTTKAADAAASGTREDGEQG